MTLPLVPVLAGGAVVAYVATEGAAPAKPGATGYATPSAGSSPPAPPPRYMPPGGKAHVGQALMGAVTIPPALKTTTWNSTPQNNIDPSLQAKLDAAYAAVKTQFDNMNEVAKVKSADYLNKELKLNPPLNGHEDWETITAVVGAATGAAVGAAIGGPIGAKIGALLGAYLGKELTDFIAEVTDIDAYHFDPAVSQFASVVNAGHTIQKVTGGSLYQDDVYDPGEDSTTQPLSAYAQRVYTGNPQGYNPRGNATLPESKGRELIKAWRDDQAREGFHGLNTADRDKLNAIAGAVKF